MTTTPNLNDLTVPEALMAFLFTRKGVPIEAAKPKELAAAAELAELLLAGHVHLQGDRLRASAGVEGERPWVREVTSALAAQQPSMRTWIKQRREALELQQREAERRGVVTLGRTRFLGLFSYASTVVDPGVRAALLSELRAPGAEQAPRAVVLAKMVVTARLHLWNQLDEQTRTRLVALAEIAPANTPAASALTAIDLAIGTVIYTTVISD